MILPAQPTDHLHLTQLTQQSKGHWGYTKEQLKKWAADLTITSEYITEHIVFKLVEENAIKGYYSLLHQDSKTIELDNLFIHPTVIGKGYGSVLLKDALERSRNKGYEKMILYADPHATDFYLKKGVAIIGQFETSIPDRYLPIMEQQL